jgi:hypothetical protein
VWWRLRWKVLPMQVLHPWNLETLYSLPKFIIEVNEIALKNRR